MQNRTKPNKRRPKSRNRTSRSPGLPKLGQQEPCAHALSPAPLGSTLGQRSGRLCAMRRKTAIWESRGPLAAKRRGCLSYCLKSQGIRIRREAIGLFSGNSIMENNPRPDQLPFRSRNMGLEWW